MATKTKFNQPKQKLIFSKDNTIGGSVSTNENSLVGLFKSSASLGQSIRCQPKLESSSNSANKYNNNNNTAFQSSASLIMNQPKQKFSQKPLQPTQESITDIANLLQSKASFKKSVSSNNANIQLRNITHNYADIDVNQDTYKILSSLKSQKRNSNLDTLDDYEVYKSNYLITTEDEVKKKVLDLKQNLDSTQNEIYSKFSMKDEELIPLVQNDIDDIEKFYRGVIEHRNNDIKITNTGIVDIFNKCLNTVKLKIVSLGKDLDLIGYLLEEEIEKITSEKKEYITKYINNKIDFYNRVINEIRDKENEIVKNSEKDLIEFILRWKNIKLNHYLKLIKKYLRSNVIIDNEDRYLLIDNMQKDQKMIYSKRKNLIFDKLFKLKYEDIYAKNIENINKELEDIYSESEKIFNDHIDLLMKNSEDIQNLSNAQIEVFKQNVSTLSYNFSKDNHNEKRYNNFDDINSIEELIDKELNPILNINKQNRTNFLTQINNYIDDYDEFIHSVANKMINLFLNIGKLYDEHKVNLHKEEKDYQLSLAKAGDNDDEVINEKEEKLKQISIEMKNCINKEELDSGLENSFKVMDELAVEYRDYFKLYDDILNSHEDLLTKVFHLYEQKCLKVFGIYDKENQYEIENRRNIESNFLSKKKEAEVAFEEAKAAEEEAKNAEKTGGKKKPPAAKKPADKKAPLKKGEVPPPLVPPREIKDFKSKMQFDYLIDYTIEELVKHYFRNIIYKRDDDIFELKPKSPEELERIKKEKEEREQKEKEEKESGGKKPAGKKPDSRKETAKKKDDKANNSQATSQNESSIDFYKAFDPYNADTTKEFASPVGGIIANKFNDFTVKKETNNENSENKEEEKKEELQINNDQNKNENADNNNDLEKKEEAKEEKEPEEEQEKSKREGIKLLSEENDFTVPNIIENLKTLFDLITDKIIANKNTKVDVEKLNDNDLREERLTELDIRLKKIPPRKGKIEVEEYDKRLNELEKHDAKLKKHIENITNKNTEDNENNNKLLEKLDKNYNDLNSQFEALSKDIDEAETSKKLEDKYKDFKTLYYDFLTQLGDDEIKLNEYAEKNPSNLMNLNNNYLLSLQPHSKGGTYSDREIEFTKNELKNLDDNLLKTAMEERKKINEEKINKIKADAENLMKQIDSKYLVSNENIMAKDCIGKKFGAPKRLINDIIINIKLKCNQAQEGLDGLLKELKKNLNDFNSIKNLDNLNSYLSKNELPLTIRKLLSKINNCVFCYGKYIEGFKNTITTTYNLARVLMKENVESCEIVNKEDIDYDEKLKNEELLSLGFLAKLIIEGNPNSAGGNAKNVGGKGGANQADLTYNDEISAIDDKIKAECAKIYVGEFAKFLNAAEKLPDSLVTFLANVKTEMELLRLKSVRELRTFCQNLYIVSLDIPACVMKFIFSFSLLQDKNITDKLNNDYDSIKQNSKKTKDKLNTILGPYLANPYYQKDLENIYTEDNERNKKVIESINKTQFSLIESEEKLSKEFTIRILNNFESLMLLFDNFIFEEEFISLGDEEYFKKRQNYNELLKLKGEIDEMKNNKDNVKGGANKNIDISNFDLNSKRTFKKIYKGLNYTLSKINYYQKFTETVKNIVENSEEKIKILQTEYSKDNWSKSITGIKLDNNKNLFLNRNEYYKLHCEQFNKNIDKDITQFNKERADELEYKQKWEEMMTNLKEKLAINSTVGEQKNPTPDDNVNINNKK